MRALEGTQPDQVQSPPKRFFSINKTLAPNLPAVAAAAKTTTCCADVEVAAVQRISSELVRDQQLYKTSNGLRTHQLILQIHHQSQSSQILWQLALLSANETGKTLRRYNSYVRHEEFASHIQNLRHILICPAVKKLRILKTVVISDMMKNALVNQRLSHGHGCSS